MGGRILSPRIGGVFDWVTLVFKIRGQTAGHAEGRAAPFKQRVRFAKIHQIGIDLESGRLLTSSAGRGRRTLEWR